MTTEKTITLTRWTFVSKVMSLLFNMLSRLIITFLPRSKRLLIHGCTTLSLLQHSFSVMSDSLRPHGLYRPWNSPAQNTGVGRLSLFQQIFPTQELNRGLLRCRLILYQLSYEGSPLMSLIQGIKPRTLSPSPEAVWKSRDFRSAFCLFFPLFHSAPFPPGAVPA